MKKVIFIFALLSLFSKTFAQDLTISFQPKVSGTLIDSIQVINLRSNQVLKLSDGESLLLVKTPTGINSFHDNFDRGLIYPNPTEENAIFSFSTDKNQEVELRLYNTSGQLLNQNRQYLTQGSHCFDLKFPIAGIYYLSVLKSNGSESYKALYTGKKIQTSSVLYAGNEKLNSQKPNENRLKSATTDKTLTYAEGDFIQYLVSSGVNTTIITETPTISKTFDVEFVSCIDNDNKSYKAVKVGTQWWMAENMAYLPAVSPPTLWSQTEPFYYVYDFSDSDISVAKSTANYETYGVLYNWVAAKAACPIGWHLPSDAEWKQLEMALGMTQAQADETGWRGTDQGTQMKATNRWQNNGNGNNSSGFAALPAGFCGLGTFSGIGVYGNWWVSTEGSSKSAWSRTMSYNIGNIFSGGNSSRDAGFSVRCVRD